MDPRPTPHLTRRSVHSLVATLVAVAAVAGVSACSDSGDGTAAQKSAQKSASASARASAEASMAKKDTKRIDVTRSLRRVTCAREADGWSFSANVRNATAKAADVTVVVRVVPSSDSNASVGLTSITKTVPGKGSEKFQARAFSKAKAQGNRCQATASTALRS